MDKFLDTDEHPKLNQDDINHLKRSITCNEIEAVIKGLQKKNSPGPDGFTAEFYQTFKEELTPTVLSVFHTMEREVGTGPAWWGMPHTSEGKKEVGKGQQSVDTEQTLCTQKCKWVLQMGEGMADNCGMGEF
jgi:hypothetical protein